MKCDCDKCIFGERLYNGKILCDAWHSIGCERSECDKYKEKPCDTDTRE